MKPNKTRINPRKRKPPDASASVANDKLKASAEIPFKRKLSNPRRPIKNVATSKAYSDSMATLVLSTPPASGKKGNLAEYSNEKIESQQVIYTPVRISKRLRSKEVTPSPKGQFILGTPLFVRNHDYYEVQLFGQSLRGEKSVDRGEKTEGSCCIDSRQNRSDLMALPDPKLFAPEKVVPRNLNCTKKSSIRTPQTPLKKIKIAAPIDFLKRRRRKVPHSSRRHNTPSNLGCSPPSADVKSYKASLFHIRDSKTPVNQGIHATAHKVKLRSN